MPRRAPQINLSSEERMTLEGIVRSPSAAQRDVLRARIVLLAAENLRNDQIQQKLGVSKPVVIKWRRRYATDRLEGLADLPAEDADENMMLPFVIGLRPPRARHRPTPWGLIGAFAPSLGISAWAWRWCARSYRRNPSSPTAFDTGRIPPTRNLNRRCWPWSDCTCSRLTTPSYFPWMRKPPSRRWIEPSRVCP